jgi:hypothetical protein
MLPVPFIDNIEYLVQLIGPRFDVHVRRLPAGGAGIVVRKGSAS